ncbi:MAG TPA: hypothetical protein EYQ75_08230 [Planctomycetaceae bacterium]|nr:hypothetical protein [Planctomycetaceae bacterium]
MSVSAEQFWNLAVISGLIASEHRATWEEQFAAACDEARQRESVRDVAKWLIEQNIISRYQAGVLLTGKSGPFRYGNYQIYDRIAEGVWKGCYRAIHHATRHPVVLKFIPTKQLQIDSWSKIQGIVQSRQELEHPVLLKCHVASSEGKYRILVFDDFPVGESLADRLDRGALAAKEAARITRVLALGLVPIHAAGQAHADLRPTNIWLAENGGVFLICDPSQVMSSATPEIALEQANYRAPEFPLPGPAYAPLADTYALGCSLYECLNGGPAFPDGDVALKQQCHAAQPITPINESSAPGALFQLITYLMAKNPEIRYQQIADVAEQLAPFLDGSALKIPSRETLATESEFRAAVRSETSVVAVSGLPGQPSVVTPPAAQPPILPPANPLAAQSAPAFQTMPPPAPNAAASMVVQGSDTNQTLRIRQKKKRQLQQVLLTAVALTFIAGGGYVGYTKWRTPSLSELPESDNEDDVKVTVAVEDDGTLLWDTPTHGPPLDLSMIPFESLALIAIRPKKLLGQEEGQRLFRAMGPQFSRWRRGWEDRVGFNLDQVDQLLISLHPRGDEMPEPAYVITLAEKIERSELLAKFGDLEEQASDGDSFYSGSDFAVYLPDGDMIERFALGSSIRMKDVAELEGGAPPPRTGTERLIRASDRDRHLTILFVPYFVSTNLLRDGREFYFGEAQKVREPLDWLMGSSIKAALFSVHLSNNTYLELQINSDVTKNPYTVVDDLRHRVSELPMMIETYIAQKLNPPVYWRRIAFRYPDMIAFLHDHTRIQVDGKLAVVNTRLPNSAAHNLAAGGELLLATRPSEMMVIGDVKPTIPQTMDELLATTTKIAFSQLSFENVIRTIENDLLEKHPALPFFFDIKVIGRDLEGNGITRNKEVRNFDASGTVADVLTQLCLKTNPVTTVTKPSEKDQKLVWVIGPDPDNESKTVILITTRDASAAKNYTLPKPFQLKE